MRPAGYRRRYRPGGPQIAEKLHLPQVTYAADIHKDGDTVTVKRMLEDGYMTIKVKTPACSPASRSSTSPAT